MALLGVTLVGALSLTQMAVGSEVLYQKALVHEDSIVGQAAVIAEEWWNSGVCSQLCNKKPGCNGFYKSVGNKCTLVSGLKPAALVETSPLSVNAKHIFYASPISVERTSHFLTIYQGGLIEDFSEDPVVSPPITSYPLSHTYIGENSPYVFDKNKTLTMIQENGGTSMFQWSFDNQSIVTVSSIAPKHGSYSGWATQNNILYINGGGSNPKLVSIFKNGEFVPGLQLTGNNNNKHCITFVPDDNYFVYLTGGENPFTGNLRNQVFQYNFAEDSYTLITYVPTPNNYGISNHGCTGVRTADNKRALVIVGGRYDAASNPSKNQAFLYNIDNNAWETLTSYPITISNTRAIFWKGYIYCFGGATDSGFTRNVWKMLPKKNAAWILVGQLKSSSTRLASIVPYNA